MAQNDLLLPWLSVLDNVLLGFRLRGQKGVLAEERSKALSLLAQVGLAERAADLPDRLSGGMRQRAALARTLMEDRPVVLMDEPFAALDAITRYRLQALAAKLLAGRTIFLVTHDPLEALRLCDQVFVLAGPPTELHGPLEPTGTAPRPLDDPNLLAQQGEILALLLAGEEAA